MAPPIDKSPVRSNVSPMRDLITIVVIPAPVNATDNVPVAEVLGCVTVTPALFVMSKALSVVNVHSLKPLACVTKSPLSAVMEALLIVNVHSLLVLICVTATP